MCEDFEQLIEICVVGGERWNLYRDVRSECFVARRERRGQWSIVSAVFEDLKKKLLEMYG